MTIPTQDYHSLQTNILFVYWIDLIDFIRPLGQWDFGFLSFILDKSKQHASIIKICILLWRDNTYCMFILLSQ